MDRNALKTVGGLIILALLGFFAFVVARAIWQGFTSLESEVAVAVAGAGGAVLIGAIGHYFQGFWIRKHEIDERQRPKKMELYQELVGLWFEVLNIGKIKRQSETNFSSSLDLVPKLNEITQQLILWGSDDALKAYSNLRRYTLPGPAQENNPIDTMLLFESLMYALRKDLGHSNKRLKEGDILSLFINDMEKLNQRSLSKRRVRSKR